MERKVEVTHYGIKLPSLSDNFAISMYMQSTVSMILGLVILFRPSAISAQNNSVIQMVIPAICITVAFLIQMVNAWRITITKSKLLAAAGENHVEVLTTSEYKYYFGGTLVKHNAAVKLRKQDARYGVANRD